MREFSIVSPLMPATVAVFEVAFRNSAGLAVVVTVYDLLCVSAFGTFVFTESVGQAADLT